MLEQILRLMQTSAHHGTYDVDAVMRCIVPPLNLGQHQFIAKDGVVKAWLSWAWMTPETSEAFLDGAYKVQPADWCAGGDLVFMDVIAQPGYGRALFKQVRPLFMRQDRAAWIRHAKGNRKVRICNVQR